MDRTGQTKRFHYRTEEGRIIEDKLAKTFEELLTEVADTRDNRQKICEYTLGYMGASYGIYVHD